MLDDLQPLSTQAIVGDLLRLQALDSYGILDTPPEEGFNDIVQLATQICETPVSLVASGMGYRFITETGCTRYGQI